jgi:hypothetical protein
MGCRAPARRRRLRSPHRRWRSAGALHPIAQCRTLERSPAGPCCSRPRSSRCPGQWVSSSDRCPEAPDLRRTMGCRAPARRRRLRSLYRRWRSAGALHPIARRRPVAPSPAGPCCSRPRSSRFAGQWVSSSARCPEAPDLRRTMGCRAPARRRRLCSLHRRWRSAGALHPNAQCRPVAPSPAGPCCSLPRSSRFAGQWVSSSARCPEAPDLRRTMGCRAPARRRRLRSLHRRWRSAGALHPIARRRPVAPSPAGPCCSRPRSSRCAGPWVSSSARCPEPPDLRRTMGCRAPARRRRLCSLHRRWRSAGALHPIAQCRPVAPSPAKALLLATPKLPVRRTVGVELCSLPGSSRSAQDYGVSSSCSTPTASQSAPPLA